MFDLGVQSDNDWRKQAECYKRRDEVQKINKNLGYDMFYPETGKNIEALKWSRKFCDPCPVKVACFTEGINEQGTWGGDQEKKRRRLVRTLNTSLSRLLERLPVQSQDENKLPTEDEDPYPESKIHQCY